MPYKYKKILILAVILFSKNAFSYEDGTNWELIRKSEYENCKKAVILKDNNKFDVTKREHQKIRIDCIMFMSEKSLK